MLKTIAFLIGGTFASEDLTCVSAGQLIAAGLLHPGVGIIGCTVGIFVGDMGLWLAGYVLGRSVITRRLSHSRVHRAERWLDRNIGAAILASRFLPGTRVPLYVAAGALRQRAGRFAFWTLLAALLWTPLIVLLVAFIGDAFVARFLGRGWITLVIAAISTVVLLKMTALVLAANGRAKIVATVSRVWRWEFWPTWLFYAPLLPWIAWLSIRHRGFTTITAANPGIPHGGFVGESKFQILSQSRHPDVAPTVRLRSGASLGRILEDNRWTFPLILKPDIGERGAGVKLAETRDDAIEYLECATGAVVVQPYHPGPHEAGIFYYRIPGESRGRIFSITDKRFSMLVGDGVSTLEQLIWRHPRYRMQAPIFLARHADKQDQVLAAGQHFRLAVAGNHCQGTMFCDGSHLITPELERKIDQVAQTFDGFYFGRFDVRYSDVGGFKAGKDLCVIELNGITSESTNIYDPSHSLLRAYQTLARQWSILFKIGAANRTRGARESCFMDLLRDIIAHFRTSRPASISD